MIFLMWAKRNFMIFSIGAIGYGLIEIIWRGHTHWSMLTAGGVSFMGLSAISERFKNLKLFFKAIIGGALITAIEFIYGIIFNVFLHKNVWDYSKMPLNLGGQVCALYSFFWVALSFVSLPFLKALNKLIKRKIG